MKSTDTDFDWELRQIEKELLKHHNSAENIMNVFTNFRSNGPNTLTNSSSITVAAVVCLG